MKFREAVVFLPGNLYKNNKIIGKDAVNRNEP